MKQPDIKTIDDVIKELEAIKKELIRSKETLDKLVQYHQIMADTEEQPF